MKSWTAGGLTLRKLLSGIMALVTLSAAVPMVTFAESDRVETAIVWVADVSGSVPEIDSQRYWADAISLGVELAPRNTEAAIIAVNDTIVAQTPLLSISDANNRAEISGVARNAAVTGYTDFALGIDAALDLLEESAAKNKHIFVVGDFSEAGFMYQNGDYSHVPDEMASLTQRLLANNVKVTLLFMRIPGRNSEFELLWDELADKTRGRRVQVDDPKTLPNIVESLYFNEFDYNMTVTTGINTSDIAQDIPIRIPDLGLYRARIYVSPDNPIRGMQARVDRGSLSYTENRGFFVIDLIPTMPEVLTLTLPPGDSNNVRVYLIADGGITAIGEADSTSEMEVETRRYRQKTTVTVTPLVDNEPLYTGATQPDARWTLTATDPYGQISIIDTAIYKSGSIIYEFTPDSFGSYSFQLTLESQGIRLSAEATAEISEIELPLTWRQKLNEYAIWIAAAIGALLIIAAILFALSRRKRAAKDAATLNYIIPVPIADPAPAGLFDGKLDIYGILVEGGKVEIPAMSVRLDTFVKRKSVTLETVFEQAGIPYQYPAASQIVFYPRSNNAIEVKNNSNAMIYCGGQSRSRGQQAVMVYGQKMRIVFENEVSEYDIFYHNATKFAASGDHILVEATD